MNSGPLTNGQRRASLTLKEKLKRHLIPAVRLQRLLMLLSRDIERLVTLRAPVLVRVRVIMKIPFQRNPLL